MQVRGAFPLTNFYQANATAVNMTVTGLADAFGRTQPDATASANYQHWCVWCQLIAGWCGNPLARLHAPQAPPGRLQMLASRKYGLAI